MVSTRTGRTPRGRARRDALVSAAARLLVEHGPAGVTARAVATSAGVALGGVTYYFVDGAQMMREASEQVLREHVERAREQVAAVTTQASTRDVAARLVRLVLGPYADHGAQGLAALYSRVLAAAADPEWADQVRRWDEEFPPLVAALLRAAGRSDNRARAVLACTDGLAVSAGLRGSADPKAAIATELADVLDVLAPRLT